MGHRGVQYTVMSASVVIVAAAALVVAVEREAPGASLTNFPDGLWWAVTTVTTVGYGDTYPITAAGRGIAVALMLMGIAPFSALTANLAALLVQDQEDPDPSKKDEVLAQLHEINERLRRLEEREGRAP